MTAMSSVNWQDAADFLFGDLIDISEDRDSVRSPGWYKAACNECVGWEPSGSEATVRDWAREHVAERHLEFTERHIPAGSGVRAGIVSYPPPGTLLEPGVPHASVSVCGLDGCTATAAAYVRFLTGHDGVFRLDPVQPAPMSPLHLAGLDPASPVAQLVAERDELRAKVDSLQEALSTNCAPNATWVAYKNRVVDDARRLRVELARALGVPDDERTGAPPHLSDLLEAASRSRHETEQWEATFGESALRDAVGVIEERDSLRVATRRHAGEVASLRAELAARPTMWAYEAAGEALERRRELLVRALDVDPDTMFHDAVRLVSTLSASPVGELAAVRAALEDAVGSTGDPLVDLVSELVARNRVTSERRELVSRRLRLARGRLNRIAELMDRVRTGSSRSVDATEACAEIMRLVDHSQDRPS
jgi:hypothetical protein